MQDNIALKILLSRLLAMIADNLYRSRMHIEKILSAA
jgi:hypothetical protein